MPIGPPPCLTGRGRASPCRRFCRAGPVLVPWALIAAQARPGAWHGPGTSPPAPGPDRDSAVLSWAGLVPAQRARPSWPAIRTAPPRARMQLLQISFPPFCLVEKEDEEESKDTGDQRALFLSVCS